MTANAVQLEAALNSIEAGRWVVGVSGGLDSVALLLLLLRHRPDITPIIAHLDHQFRGPESDADRQFVIDLCERLGVACTVSRLDEWPDVDEPNLEARFREARLRFFARESAEHGALGVLVAQHADDRAETILLRLLRGGEPWALDGLRRDRLLGSLRIVRPLLEVRRSELGRFLTTSGERWREDSSNQDTNFARNRVRQFLSQQSQLVERLLKMGDAADALRTWVESNSPVLPPSIPTATLADLPDALARHSLRKWLLDAGVGSELILPLHVDRLLQMARDSAMSPLFELPGKHVAHRQRGFITLRPK